MKNTAAVRQVLTPRDRRAFVLYPYARYRDDPLWVPPLRSGLWAEFDPRRNAYLAHCDHALFLLEEGGRIQGRIAAMVDTLALEAWGEKIGMFAYFECRDADTEGAGALLDAAAAWLRERGMERIRGPWSFQSQEWGTVVEGFSPRPVVMAPHNPPGYGSLLEAWGLRKAKDLLCWEISMPEGYRIPDRILRLTDSIRDRLGIHTRRIDMARYAAEVESFARLSIATLEGNWGFSPITDAEVAAMARELRPVLRPECVLFATDREGRDVGFALVIPDVNEILQGLGGRMLPFGWAKMLLGIPRLRRYRMFGLGVAEGYQGKGVDALLYRAMWEELATPELTMEINYVLEDNWPMVNAITKLGARPSRRYRVYEAEL